jgi:hypothetical protein
MCCGSLSRLQTVGDSPRRCRAVLDSPYTVAGRRLAAPPAQVLTFVGLARAHCMTLSRWGILYT